MASSDGGGGGVGAKKERKEMKSKPQLSLVSLWGEIQGSQIKRQKIIMKKLEIIKKEGNTSGEKG